MSASKRCKIEGGRLRPPSALWRSQSNTRRSGAEERSDLVGQGHNGCQGEVSVVGQKFFMFCVATRLASVYIFAAIVIQLRIPAVVGAVIVTIVSFLAEVAVGRIFAESGGRMDE